MATLSTAVYRQGIATSRRTVAAVQEAALTKVGHAQDDVRRAARATDSPTAGADLARAQRRLDEARAELDEVTADAAQEDEPGPDGPVPPEPAGASRWSALPWRRILLLAGSLFVVAVLLISAFELVAGRSVSSFTGGSDRDSGTSVGNIVDRGDERRERGPDRDQRPSEQPSDDATEPTPDEPSGPDEPQAPVEEPSTEPATPSEPASPPASEVPTEAPTPSATP
ncbi:hypothetical protein [Nocardioides sp. TF02-7]|uniref:hypothetical protein n=1 Tax=Nocardioides sp. TF02-7 TaxID=2917724 RepID=UPI001F06EF3E|nr:hypothetical protein [Nocardioides sp. TF02-7]UMG91358.1 hypothetical protein MF408_14470 [Nocardioides sp. TF02-7]